MSSATKPQPELEEPPESVGERRPYERVGIALAAKMSMDRMAGMSWQRIAWKYNLATSACRNAVLRAFPHLANNKKEKSQATVDRVEALEKAMRLSEARGRQKIQPAVLKPDAGPLVTIKPKEAPKVEMLPSSLRQPTPFELMTGRRQR